MFKPSSEHATKVLQISTTTAMLFSKLI